MEGAIEVVGPSEELQIVGVRNANPGVKPRPQGRTAFAERQICRIKD